MKRLEISNGDRFGRLTIIEEVPKRPRARMFLVECDCGKRFSVILASITQGKTKSCGCLGREHNLASLTKHGYNKRGKTSSTYSIWGGMIQRCSNKNDKAYQRYGGKGITVSKEWHNFENFLKDMGEKPDGLSIDRIDGTKGYFKGNCRWLQQLNKLKTDPVFIG